MDDIQTKIAAAKDAGYSDAEIASKLATLPDFGVKVKTALDAGYDAPTIISHLSGLAPTPLARTGTSADQIPLAPGARENIKRDAAAPAPAQPSTIDKITGYADAAKTLVSGAVLGSLGYVGGGLYGIGNSIANGTIGTDQGVRDAKKYAEEGAERYTLAPTTELGRQKTQDAADWIDASGVAGLPIGPELNAIGALARPARSQLAAAGARAADQYADQALSASRLRSVIDARNGMKGGGAAVSDHYNMAQATGATPDVLKAIEAAGDDVHPIAAQRHAEASSLPVPAELSAGQATGNSELISREKNLRGKYPELGDLFNRQDENIIQNFDEVRQRVAPDIAAQGTDLGQMAVDAYKKMDEPVVADITAKYKALADANGGDFPLSGADFVNAADKALKKQNKARFVPAEVRGILEDLRDGGNMTFNDFENYRTILANDIRKAQRAADGNAAGAINIVRDALESLPMTKETSAIKPLADAARDAARQRFQRIKADPAYDAAINDGTVVGQPSPLADKFIANYVVKGKAANVETMLRNLSNDPLNKQIISAGVVDHLKSASGVDLRTNTGNITQKGMNSALTVLDKKAPIVLGDEANAILNKLSNVAKWQMEQKKGTYVNNSGTTVSAIAEGAKDFANAAADVKTFGATKVLRSMMDKRAQAKMAQQSIKPGAGINAFEYPALRSEMERNRALPPAAEHPEVNTPVTAPAELSLAPEGALPATPVAPYRESPSVGLMSLADDVQPTAQSPNLAARTDYPSVDFPLRQEVLQQPEVAASITAYQIEANRLGKIAANAISAPVRAKAAAQLAQLQAQFSESMKQLGILDAADAHGLNRPLYETGGNPRMPIQKTYSPLAERIARQREINQQKLQGIANAKTIDEAIQAATGQ